MQLIDSHAHLDFEQFHDDFDAVLRRAEQVGVEKIINIGADLSRSRAAITLAENHANMFATVGVHPEEADKVNLETIHDELLGLAKSSERVVGIGETGLDYYTPPVVIPGRKPGIQSDSNEISAFAGMTDVTKENQKRLFQIHLDVAKHLSMPLVIHIRNGTDEEAVNETYEIIKKSGYTKGVIHCFTLDSAWAKRFVDLGFHIGFTGIITYKNAEEIRDAASSVPLERILVETDCPFLAPQKYRGQRNEPSYVVEVASKIAEIKGLPLDKVADETTMNVEKLFGI